MRKKFLASVASTAFALALATPAAAQIGDDPVRRMIVFGDSLADSGYYRSVAGVPQGLGRFTTNPDPVAPEIVAQELGLPLQTFYGEGGSNYAVGGARVTLPNAASIPITTQISNYLNAGGTFGPNDLVYIQGGGNDFFAYQAGGSVDNAILTSAANQLAAQVVRVQAAGGERIVTMSVQTGGMAGLALFNQTYEAALAAAGVNALFFDTDRLYNEIIANPGQFGINNITGTACVGSSLTCSPTSYVTPGANETYLLADSVHPSGIAQRIQAQAISSMLQAPEQIGQLSYAGQSLMRSHREVLEGPMRGGLIGEGTRLFGHVGFSNFTNGDTPQRIGLDETTLTAQLGADFAVGEAAGFGIAGSYSTGEGDFARGSGGYDVNAWSLSGYARAHLGPIELGASATYGNVSYDDITRVVPLGPAVREHVGSTDGDYLAASASAGFALIRTAGLIVGPEIGIAYERLELDGYAEGDTLSTSAVFGGQEVENLTGRIGVALSTAPSGPVRFLARVSYEHELDGEEREITITPAGAPISYTSDIYTAEDDYVSYSLSLDGALSRTLSVRAGVRGELNRAEFDSITGYGGVALAF